MNTHDSLRKSISSHDHELIIYATDNYSQFPRRDASIYSKSDRALAVAGPDDLVVLHGELDIDYHQWLRSLGLGSDHSVQYNAQSNKMTLSEHIIQNPEPVLQMIQKSGRKPVYVPWFSGHKEAEAAEALGAELFGASESDTIRHNDKALFKNLCVELGIAVVEGNSFEMFPDKSENYLEMETIIKGYLQDYKTVIVRGTLGEVGMSLYKTEGDDIAELYKTIADSGEKMVIIEPFLNVSSSPNDQWSIGRDGEITHLGMREQLCERGLVHVGNLKGKTTAPDVYTYITGTSLKLVNHMAETGYIGLIGIDYIVSDEGIFPVENNARFNGSSYVSMIVDNIEEKTGPVPFWKFIKIKTAPCSFLELAERLKTVLYDGKRSNSVFPYDFDGLSKSGKFSVIIMAQNMDKISSLEASLKELGISRN